MTIGQLKEGIMALLKKPPRQPVSLQDKMISEYVTGYNKAIADVMLLIAIMKKESNGTGTGSNTAA